ncbi:MAG: type III-A CRISPR-associated RAMP protein Csm3 [Deltaproteobacteria bacterium]|nr:type III-A CRISPR-associated RAMP protein Csm3 [Deltaproteobacteria bacterium]MBW2078211.1 type III-A CRISPR-associated RAMP protein Csm3 [Deltaproteobacteria bacterium]
MKLENIREITGKIILRSGLHIGAGDTDMKIGGTDNTVIKHPYTMEPYIPGSSLKGKVRSLLEMRSGLMTKTEGSPVSLKIFEGLEGKEKEECGKILKLFGASGADVEEAQVLGPTRASFADCPLDDEWREKALNQNIPYTEIKPETAIDRIKGTAKAGSLRITERVPADTEFRFCITLKKLSDDDELEDFLLEGLRLLQMDSLGGNGSRGYGRIKLDFDDKEIKKRFDEIIPL